MGIKQLHYLLHVKMEKKTIVKYLVEYGADVNKRDKNKITPLFIACLNGNEALVKYLVEHGSIGQILIKKIHLMKHHYLKHV